MRNNKRVVMVAGLISSSSAACPAYALDGDACACSSALQLMRPKAG